MVARVSTVAFQGIEGVPVDVQVMVAPGKLGMQMVGWINWHIFGLSMGGLRSVRGSDVIIPFGSTSIAVWWE